MPSSNTCDRDALRERLIELRADTLRQLAAALPAVDTGLLAIAAHTSIVLAALEDEVRAGAGLPD